MIRRLLQPNLIRRAVAIAIGGGRYASTGFLRASGGPERDSIALESSLLDVVLLEYDATLSDALDLES